MLITGKKKPERIKLPVRGVTKKAEPGRPKLKTTHR